MSSTNSIPSISPTTTQPLPEQVKVARKRSRDVIGSHLKCKFCSSKDAWISEEDRMKWVNCETCGNHYPLKMQHYLSPKDIINEETRKIQELKEINLNQRKLL